MSVELNKSGNTYNASNTPQGPNNNNEKKNSKGAILGVLIIALLATWAYIVYDKYQNKSQVNTLQSQSVANDSSRASIEAEYNDALLRMDSLVGSNVQLKGELAERQKEIDQIKLQVRDELRSSNGDLKKAKSLIAQLRSKVNSLMQQVDELRAENKLLYADNEELRTQRDTLTNRNTKLSKDLTTTTAEKNRVTDEASTLHASAFNIVALKVGKNGEEKETEKAKKANVLRVMFNLDENQVAPSGQKEVYMVLTNPSGAVVTIPSAGSGTFTARKEGTKTFTAKVNVNYVQGKTIPVSFDWHQDGKYQDGTYKIEIYQNGYKIGQGVKELKKSGFLGL